MYDKVARMMGLGYPGGPIIDKLAEQGNPKAISFPRPKPTGHSGATRIRPEQRTDMDMSFSGLKTAVRQYLERNEGWSAPDVAASFQAAVIDVLIDRILKGVEKTGVKSHCDWWRCGSQQWTKDTAVQFGLAHICPSQASMH